MDIAGTIVTFGDLAIKIKESIEKVGDNEENLADLKQEVLNTVEQLQSLAQEHEDKAPTEQLLKALKSLTEQLETIEEKCQALAQSKLKKIPAFVQAWYKRDKIEAEIKKLKDHRKYCCDQFQLFSLVRVERHTARTEEHAAQIKVTTARTEETAARTEAKADQLISLARKEELQRWFQAIDMRGKQRATHALRHNDTGSWFLEDTKFAKWKEQPGYLWLRGNSGTGKSVLSSIAIDHLFEYRAAQAAKNGHPATPSFGIAYFYFDFRDENKQLFETMLRSIIMQLSEQSPTPYSVLDRHFKSCQGGKFPTYNNLLAMLDTILAEFTGTYIILDALDECSELDELVHFISTLRGWEKSLHFLVASQPRTIFLDSAAFDGALVVVLERDTTHADILQFVNSKLELDSKLKHIKKAKDAAPKIVDKSNGMFRMAACLLQELTRKRVDTNIDKILAKLPNDLFGIYTRFLQSIDEVDFVYVAALLRWVTFSVEPVTLCQLDEALAINFSKPDHWVFESENRGRVEDVCGLLEGLVTIVPATPTSTQHRVLVALAHSSVNDYIKSQKFLDEYKHDLGEAPSHTFLAQSCVTYLLHFEHNPLNADTLPQYSLALYAAKYWSHHLLRCHDRGVLQSSTMHLLEQGSQQYAVLNCLYDIDKPWNRRADWSRHAPWPLHLCSLIGYIEGVEFLLDHGADVNTAGRGYGSALQSAAVSGNVDIIRVLLENSADVNAAGGEYGNAAGGEYGSALQNAAWKGHVDAVRVLLEKGADVNIAGGSVLQSAASRGHMDIVHVLLDHGADVNTVGGAYGSALQGAAWNCHVDAVRVLLEKGADVNAVNGEYGSALQAAAWWGYMDIVHVLLDHGADVNAAGGEYGSALQGAAWNCHVDAVRVLLEKGADVNAVNGEYGSALQAAAWWGYMDIVHVLLDHGADVNAAGGEYGSALYCAASSGHLDIVHLLLEKGADVHTEGGFYGSTLQGAATTRNVDTVRVLLEKGADVHISGGWYGSALQGAAARGNVDIVHLLLEKGADVNATGGEYGSALAAASAEGHEVIAQLLCDHGALDAESGEDSNRIHCT
ncbi:ankyrin repeat-containing domain protein [Mycena polygramma]|nr:ankyrin repeat-containing domain protein [Mycena polygramma]